MKRWAGVAGVAASLLVVVALGPGGARGVVEAQRSERPGVSVRKGVEGRAGRRAARPGTAQRRRRRQRNQHLAGRGGLPPAKIAGEVAAERVSVEAPQADFPALAVTGDGAVWAAWVEWNGVNRDRVLVRRKGPDGKWSECVELKDGCFEHYTPALAARGREVVAVWPGHNPTSFDLYWTVVRVDQGGRLKTGPIQQLTDAPHSDFNVRVAVDAQGNVTVVWQTFRNGQGDVYACRIDASGQVGPSVRISPSEANDWEPAVAVDSQGVAWVVWDSYEHGNYDVFLRSFDGREAGRLVAVTTEPTAQFHSTIAVDAKDRKWVAWDEAGVNWGKDFSRSSAAPGSRGLHYSRQLGLRVVERGLVYEPTADLKKILTGRMSRYAELPALQFDGSGTLWLVFRHWTITRPHEMYHFYATKLTGDGWSVPVRLANSSGRNTQHADVARSPDGAVYVVYSSDGRAPGVKPKDAVHALPYVVYLARLPAHSRGEVVGLRPVQLPPATGKWQPRARQTYRVGDRQYVLLFGDCHRHTDVRGHSGVDGSALDTYRYALDAAQLDFLGLGDHNQVTAGEWPDGLRDYQWWYQQKFVDLFTHEPRFMGIYSYEHSLSRPSGHRNVLYLKRGAPLRVADRSRNSPDNLPPNLWKWMEENVLTQPGQRVVIVPHTFAAGPLADWKWPNPPFDCLLEIYQGCRGSYEAWRLPPGEKRGPTQTDEPGHFARDALAVGNVYGFVSFSDHGSTHNSWAGVWAEKPTRSSLFDAMLAKRTFAASDEIILKVVAVERASGRPVYHAVGEHIKTKLSSPLTIEMEVEAPEKILRVDVVRNGKYVFTTHPNRRRFRATFTDTSPEPGEGYYYVRVFQVDPENPEGDPEIGWASPFFVTYEP